jgi:hypothetical protein
MIPLFKPLLSFRKYIRAGKVLNHVLSSYVAIIETDTTKPKSYIEMPQHEYFGGIESSTGYTKNQVNQAVIVLEENKHATIDKNPDFYLTRLNITDKGIIANEDGFYTKRAVKTGLAFFITLGAIISAIVAAVNHLATIRELVTRLISK